MQLVRQVRPLKNSFMFGFSGTFLLYEGPCQPCSQRSSRVSIKSRRYLLRHHYAITCGCLLYNRKLRRHLWMPYTQYLFLYIVYHSLVCIHLFICIYSSQYVFAYTVYLWRAYTQPPTTSSLLDVIFTSTNDVITRGCHIHSRLPMLV